MKQSHSSTSSPGFTLVEVLIAMLVLSIGIVGIAGIELTVLRLARQSAYQENALRLASDIGELLRQYRRSAASLPLDLTDLDFPSGQALPAAPAKPCLIDQCDSAELAQAELFGLMTRLRQTLPQPRLRICHDVAPWDGASAAYVWQCTAGTGAPTDSTLAVKIGWREPGKRSGSRGQRPEPEPRVVLSVHGEPR